MRQPQWEHDCRWQLCVDPGNGGITPSEKYTFTRPSILFRPHESLPEREGMVEPPGTAPGSEPLIACPFIAIVPRGTGDI